PAGLPTDLATPAVTAKSQGPTGTHVISPTPSAGLSPQAQTSGPLAVGTVLNGRHRITQEVGKGAFGRVYRAEDMLDAATPPLAIKELQDEPCAARAGKQEAARWFRREVSTLPRLEHPSIPSVHAY